MECEFGNIYSLDPNDPQQLERLYIAGEKHPVELFNQVLDSIYNNGDQDNVQKVHAWSAVLCGCLSSGATKTAWKYQSDDERKLSLNLIAKAVGSVQSDSNTVFVHHNKPQILENIAIAISFVWKFEQQRQEAQRVIEDGLLQLQQGNWKWDNAFVCWRVMKEFMTEKYFDKDGALYDVRVNALHKSMMSIVQAINLDHREDTWTQLEREELLQQATECQILECLKICVHEFEKQFSDRAVIEEVVSLMEIFRVNGKPEVLKLVYECMGALCWDRYSCVDGVMQKFFEWSIADLDVPTRCSAVCLFWKRMAKKEFELSFDKCRNFVLGGIPFLVPKLLENLYVIGESIDDATNNDIVKCLGAFLRTEPDETIPYITESWNLESRARKLSNRDSALKLFGVIVRYGSERIVLDFLDDTPVNGNCTNLETLYSAGTWVAELVVTVFDIFLRILERKPRLLDPARLLEIINAHVNSENLVVVERCMELLDCYITKLCDDTKFDEVFELLEGVSKLHQDDIDSDDIFSGHVLQCYLSLVQKLTETDRIIKSVILRLEAKPQSARSFGDLCVLLASALTKAGSEGMTFRPKLLIDFTRYLETETQNELDCIRVLTVLLGCDGACERLKKWLDCVYKNHKDGDENALSITLAFISRAFEVAPIDLLKNEKDRFVQLLIADFSADNVLPKSYPQILDTLSSVFSSVYAKDYVVLSARDEVFDDVLPKLGLVTGDADQLLALYTSIINCYVTLIEISHRDSEFLTMKRWTVILRFLNKVYLAGTFSQAILTSTVQLLCMVLDALSNKVTAHMKHPAVQALLHEAQRSLSGFAGTTAGQLITLISY